MPAQLTYTQNHSAAYAGDKANSDDMTVKAGLNTDVVELPYGRAVVLGAALASPGVNDPSSCILPVDANSVFLGVNLHSQAHNPNNTNGVLVGDMLNVMTKGLVYVEVEQAVTPASAVFFRHTLAGATGTSPALGKFRTDADTAKALAVTNARFRGTAAAGGIVALELNMP